MTSTTTPVMIDEETDQQIRSLFQGVSKKHFAKVSRGLERSFKKMLGETIAFSSIVIDDADQAARTLGCELTYVPVRPLDTSMFNDTDRYHLETVARTHALARKKVNMKYEVSLRMLVDPLLLAASAESDAIIFPEHKIAGGHITVNDVEYEATGAADYVAGIPKKYRDIQLVLSRGSVKPQAPLFHLLEVKRSRDLDSGIGQLTAELTAALSLLGERGKDEPLRGINGMLTDGMLYYVMRMEEQEGTSVKRLLWNGDPLMVFDDEEGREHVYQLLQTCLAGKSPFLEEVPASPPKKEAKVESNSFITPSGKHRITTTTMTTTMTTLVTPTDTQPIAAMEKIIPHPTSYGKRAVPGPHPGKSPLKKKPHVDGGEASSESESDEEEIDISSSSDEEEKPIATHLFVDPPTPPTLASLTLTPPTPPVEDEVLSDPSPVRPKEASPPRRFVSRRNVNCPIIYSPSKFKGGKSEKKGN